MLEKNGCYDDKPLRGTILFKTHLASKWPPFIASVATSGGSFEVYQAVPG